MNTATESRSVKIQITDDDIIAILVDGRTIIVLPC